VVSYIYISRFSLKVLKIKDHLEDVRINRIAVLYESSSSTVVDTIVDWINLA
jgi:hypothetical protein